MCLFGVRAGMTEAELPAALQTAIDEVNAEIDSETPHTGRERFEVTEGIPFDLITRVLSSSPLFLLSPQLGKYS